MRISKTKSKDSYTLHIIKDITKDGKRTTKSVKNLGNIKDLMDSKKLSEDEVLKWAKDQANKLTQEHKDEESSIIVKYSQSKKIDKNIRTMYNGGYLFLQDIFYKLELNKICNNITKKYKFDYDLTSILSSLLYARILKPCSKSASYNFIQTLIEKFDFERHDIYRALTVLSKEMDYIQSQVYKNSLKVVDRNTSVLYYDCTNYYFEIEDAENLKQYGHSKENRPSPIVQMGLFIDGSGIPLGFCINPGNQNEQKSLKPIETQIIKDFNLSKFVICTDAGLSSQENREFNNTKNRSYIVTQSLKKLKKNIKQWALDPSGWKLNTSDSITYNIDEIDESKYYNKVFYKERWINENDLEQRIIVSFSPKYKAYQRNIRDKQVERALNKIEKNKKSVNTNPNSPDRFLEEVNLTDAGEVATQTQLSFKQSRLDSEEKYDGFYAVCTTLEDDVEEIIKINKNRWEIEESFRIMKSEFKARPVYLKRDDRISAHFLTCYLSLLIFRVLEKELNEEYSAEKIIDTLEEMKFQKIPGEGYVPLYMRTELTDELVKKFGFDLDTEIVSDKKIKKIIKSSKTR